MGNQASSRQDEHAVLGEESESAWEVGAESTARMGVGAETGENTRRKIPKGVSASC